MQRKLTITFLSDWQVSSGLGDGSIADSVLIRDAEGLPYLPGRTLKGIIREGARTLVYAKPELEAIHRKIFGKPAGEGSNSYLSGSLRVGRADLLSALRDSLLAFPYQERQQYLKDLTTIRHQIAIDADKGVTQKHSLRGIECGIAGLQFGCDVSMAGLHEEFADRWLQAACSAVCNIGSGKNRGMGRCLIVCDTWKGRKVTLPQEIPEVLI